MDYYQSYLRHALIIPFLFFLPLSLSRVTWATETLNVTENLPERLSVSAGIGFPVPLTLGLNIPVTKSLQVVTEVGYLPLPLTSNLSLTFSGIEQKAHWFPWNEHIYFVGGAGYEVLQAQTILNLGSLSLQGPERASFSFHLFYVTVGVGMAWQLSERISINTDLGIQVPFYNYGNLQMERDSTADQSLENAAKGALGYFSSFALPRVNLIRINIKL